MNADQVIQGVGKAVAAVDSAQEYCLLWVNWWPMCMTKSEWSGWMQALGSILAMMVAWFIAKWQERKNKAKEINAALIDAVGVFSEVEAVILGLQRFEGNVDYIVHFPEKFDSQSIELLKSRINETRILKISEQRALYILEENYLTKMARCISQLSDLKRRTHIYSINFDINNDFHNRRIIELGESAIELSKELFYIANILKRFANKNGIHLELNSVISRMGD